MEWKWDVDVQEGGYWSDGVGGDLTFICKEGVNGSSFFTCTPPILFNPFPVSQYSRFHQMIPCTPASVLLCLCACLNSLFNCTTFSASILILFIFLALAQFFFLLLQSASSSWSKSWRLNKHVFHCTRWTYVSSSIMFGSVCWNGISWDVIPTWNQMFRQGIVLDHCAVKTCANDIILTVDW